ncbi:MAG: hypothetical protein H6733_07540 [Alphaproteobacteria bacterium]|nr:hypothetical protein [Alphaproteobacteria bacterium]
MGRRRQDFAYVLIWLVLLVLVAEVALRVVQPAPRRVIFRESKIGPFTEVHGMPLWPDDDFGPIPRPRLLEDRGCDPDGAFTVVVLGDSIFNGVSVPSAEVGSVVLKHRLEAAHPGLRVCVFNAAVPGFSLYQSIAKATDTLDAWHPDVVLLELWGGAPQKPAHVGSSIYFFRGLARDERGVANPFHLPSGLNAALLAHSRLYEYALVAMPDDCRPCRLDLTPHRPLVDGLVDAVEGWGGRVVTFMPARLSSPFDDQPSAIALEASTWRDWIAERGLENVELWKALAAYDSADLALDPVHLNAKGQAALAEVWEATIAPDVQRWLDVHAPVDQPSDAEPPEAPPSGSVP